MRTREEWDEILSALSAWLDKRMEEPEYYSGTRVLLAREALLDLLTQHNPE